MSALTKEVIEALEKSTPGPWLNYRLDTFNVKCYAENSVATLHTANQVIFSINPIGNPTGIGNAHLIANAPTWLAALCDRVELLEEFYAAYLDRSNFHQDKILRLNASLEALRGSGDK